MKAMVLKEFCEIKVKDEPQKRIDLPLKEDPLEMAELPDPSPHSKQVLINISACGVCHTELDEIEGRLVPPRFPIVLGHEIVGKIVALGTGVKRFSDSQAAPLLCAGVIGYRALRLTRIRPGGVLGLYGFGASAHIAIQVAKHWGCKVFVFTREGQKDHQKLAKDLGAEWVGATGDIPPEKLDCAIDFTPVGEPVREALRSLERGGRVVVNAIRKINPIPELEYATYIWYEKELKSVANVARRDAIDFLPLAAEIGIVPEIQEFELGQANQALRLLKQGKIQGAAVLRVD